MSRQTSRAQRGVSGSLFVPSTHKLDSPPYGDVQDRSNRSAWEQKKSPDFVADEAVYNHICTSLARHQLTLPHIKTAVHIQSVPGDVRCLVGNKERHGCSNLLRAPRAP